MSKKRPTLYVLWYYYVGIDAVTEIGLSWFLKLVLYISSAWKTIVPIVWCFKLFVSLISIQTVDQYYTRRLITAI